MDKPKSLVVTVIVAIVVLIAAGLFYLRGFNVPTDNVTVTSFVGGTEDEPGYTKSVVLNGANSYLRLDEPESQSERGLKSYEVEDIQEQLDKLRVRLGTPDKDSACDDDLPEVDTYMAIYENEKTRGIVYFCEGVGVDETSNIVGPYQDLLKLIDATEI